MKGDILCVVIDYEHRDDGEHVVVRGVYRNNHSFPIEREATTHRNVVPVFEETDMNIDAFKLEARKLNQ
jgi:hypothetical protein